MGRKKKSSSKKKVVEPVENEVEVSTDVVTVKEEPLVCSCVGNTFTVAGADLTAVCTQQRWVEKIGMNLLYFEGKKGPFNAEICKVFLEEGESNG